ncbi:MAG: hypothetical protein CMG60_05700 [Candidatus Marinimicrobia bacterium]|nr:hypothetical protein [Candidatus Neomarinimicrobiota bacterium]
MKKCKYLICLFVLPLFANQVNNYDEETLLALKERAFQEAQLLMMQEIINATKDIKINNEMREELIENLCATAPMNNFTVNADISDSLVQNAGDFSGSIFVSRDGQSSWFSSSEVALIGTEGYENTWQTSVETSGNNVVDWYLSGLINSESFGLDYGTLPVSQAPNNTYNTTGSTTYATIVTDDTGDASANYDVQNVLASYSGSNENINQLLFSLDLAGNCCDEGGLFGPWYLYGIGIVNPDSEELNAYALGYGSGGFGQLSPGLLTIEGDLANGDVAGFEYITEDISYVQDTGDKLELSVNANYLFDHPQFGAWPNSLEGLVLVGVVVEAGLDGLDIAVETLDQTDPGIVLMNSQHQSGNTALSLSDPNFDSENNQLSVTYTDSDNNLPWYKAAQICNTPENGGNCFVQLDMLPNSHTYSEGVVFHADITEELIQEFSLSGDYEAHFWFADSDDLGEAQIELPITVGDGANCLLGDSNGDGVLNVLDVVLLVNLVLAPTYEECADTNSDGQLNVLDVVLLVNLVLTP